MRAKNEVRREYHIFTDASGLAIGAAIYCVSYPSSGAPKVTLIAAKSKIIPLAKPSENPKTNFPETNTVSINKLELNGALLGLQLFETIRPLLESVDKVHCWTDSAVGLTWIRNKKQTGVKYVDTRLEKIWKLSNPEDWNHCPGKENPADMATRVCLTKELINNQVWIEGPEWLRNPAVAWPNLRETKINLRTPKIRCEVCLKYPTEQKCRDCGHKISAQERCRFLEKYLLQGDDNWKLALRRHHYLTKVRNMLLKREKSPISKPSDINLEIAQVNQIREIQGNYEPEIWKKVAFQDRVHEGLAWDKDFQLIMVRSRQYREGEQKSFMEQDLMHLPVESNNPEDRGTNPFAKAIMRDAHEASGHSPTVPTYVWLRKKFWCAKARKIAQNIKHTCPRCVRFDSKPFKAPEAPLRDYRYIGNRLFETMGVDFVGPFTPIISSNKPVSVIVFTCPLTRVVLMRAVEGVGADEFRFTLNMVCNEHNLEPKIKTQTERRLSLTSGNARSKNST